MTTIVVAASATVTRRSARAAGRAREEDHALGRARDFLEGGDHLCLASDGRCDDRYRGPHALVELAPELLHEALLIQGDIDIALSDQLLPESRSYPQELPRRTIMPEDLPRLVHLARRGRSGKGRRPVRGRRRG